MALTPRLPNSFDPTPSDGDLIAGDVHGDLDGLQNLLKSANYNPDKQRLFTVGDNIDRGHNSKGVMDFLNSVGATSILGNHDWAHARNAKHMTTEALTGKPNPMKVTPEMKDTMAQLQPDYIKYASKMGDYPLYLPFEDSQGKGHIVHGGVDPLNEIDKQEPNKMLVRRHHPMPNQFLEGETDEHPFWQKSYNGHLGTILHGHQPMSSHDEHGNPHVVSLDGGGAFGSNMPWGGKHRLIRLGDRKIFESPGSPQSEQHYNTIRQQKENNL